MWLMRLWKWLERWPWVQRLALRLLNPRFLVGVVGLAFDDRGRALLFHHTYRRRFSWSLPGGWLGRGEDPAEALAREFREEANLQIEVGELLRASARPAYPHIELLYRVRVVDGEFRPSREVDAMEFFDCAALPELPGDQRQVIIAECRMRNAE
jgi:ADP-ribose pyrophosphatase YjhB (NUDIX family)